MSGAQKRFVIAFRDEDEDMYCWQIGITYQYSKFNVEVACQFGRGTYPPKNFDPLFARTDMVTSLNEFDTYDEDGIPYTNCVRSVYSFSSWAPLMNLMYHYADTYRHIIFEYMMTDKNGTMLSSIY
jgi:hypothetical protein